MIPLDWQAGRADCGTTLRDAVMINTGLVLVIFSCMVSFVNNNMCSSNDGCRQYRVNLIPKSCSKVPGQKSR